MSFDEFCKLIMESPASYGPYTPVEKDSPKGNTKEYKSIIKDKNYTQLEPFKNLDVYFYSTSSPKTEQYHFIDNKSKIYAGKIVITHMDVVINNKPTTSITSNVIWKYKYAEKSLMLSIFIEFLLRKYPHIESMPIHSNEAIAFWKDKLMPYGIQNGYKCSYVDSGLHSELPFLSIEKYERKKDHLWSDKFLIPKIYAK